MKPYEKLKENKLTVAVYAVAAVFILFIYRQYLIAGEEILLYVVVVSSLLLASSIFHDLWKFMRKIDLSVSDISDVSMFSGYELKDIVPKTKVDTAIAGIVLGVAMTAVGAVFLGSEWSTFLGSRLIIYGSGLFYISLIVLPFLIEWES